jgi:hypothetical protein
MVYILLDLSDLYTYVLIANNSLSGNFQCCPNIGSRLPAPGQLTIIDLKGSGISVQGFSLMVLKGRTGARTV